MKPQSIYRLVLALIMSLGASGSYASPQYPDYIIYGKDTLPTYTLLLEQYFQVQGKEEQGKLFGLSFRDGASSNCWRGYKAVYIFDRDSLFLEHVLPCGEPLNAIDVAASRTRIKNIFGEKMGNGRVFINWYSGKMKFPLSKELVRWDGVFYKIFEKETVLTISKGLIQKKADVNNYMDDPNRIDRRYNSKLSNLLFESLNHTTWLHKKEFDCSETYKITIGKNGRVTKVDMALTKQEVNDYYEPGEYRFCIKKLKKAFRRLRFDIIKDMGEAITEDVFLEIWVEDDGTLENWTD